MSDEQTREAPFNPLSVYVPPNLPAGHVHRCLTCSPDMVPAFSREDPSYHDGHKCRFVGWQAEVNGQDLGYTQGIMAGPEGWALVCGPGYDAEQVHECHCGSRAVCVTPVFGVVTVIHTQVLIPLPDILIRAPVPSAFYDAMTQPALRAFLERYEAFWAWLHGQNASPSRRRKADERRVDEEVQGPWS